MQISTSHFDWNISSLPPSLKIISTRSHVGAVVVLLRVKHGKPSPIVLQSATLSFLFVRKIFSGISSIDGGRLFGRIISREESEGEKSLRPAHI